MESTEKVVVLFAVVVKSYERSLQMKRQIAILLVACWRYL